MSFFDNLGAKLSNAKKAVMKDSSQILFSVPFQICSIGSGINLTPLDCKTVIIDVIARSQVYAVRLYCHTCILSLNTTMQLQSVAFSLNTDSKINDYFSPLNNSLLQLYMQISRGKGCLSNAYMLSMPFEISFFTFVVV